MNASAQLGAGAMNNRIKELFSSAYQKPLSKTNVASMKNNLDIDDFYNYMVQHIVKLGEDDDKLDKFNEAVAILPRECLLRRYKIWSNRISNKSTDNVLNIDLNSFDENAVQGAYEIILKKML